MEYIAPRAHWSSGRCWCDDFHRDMPTLPLAAPPIGFLPVKPGTMMRINSDGIVTFTEIS